MTPRSLVSQQTCNTQLRVRGRHRGPAWGHRPEDVDMSSPQVRLAQETDRIYVKNHPSEWWVRQQLLASSALGTEEEGRLTQGGRQDPGWEGSQRGSRVGLHSDG